jgi:hypothetical protein
MEGDIDDAAEDVGRHGGVDRRAARRRGIPELLEVSLREVHDDAALPRERCDGSRAGVPKLEAHRRAVPRLGRRRARGRGAAAALLGQGAAVVGGRREDLLLLVLLHGVVEVDARHRFGGGGGQERGTRREARESEAINGDGGVGCARGRERKGRGGLRGQQPRGRRGGVTHRGNGAEYGG